MPNTGILCATLVLALIGLGFALDCYKCTTGTPCQVTTCMAGEDSCLSMESSAGFVKQCIKYDDCNKETLKARFPQMTGATSFYCCNRNLCNGTPSTTLTSPVLLILAAALFVVWLPFGHV
ncbi:CD59 glycoprotein [Erpetoichthys calabaricus]|uniref:CD59 glycoprotein n=1 Tax=Erpetoichthys calabaricus TaxID=27687 RepID=UPI002233F80F|nr:CD59 glycoprotein [Erpetoichthys calabaricus]